MIGMTYNPFTGIYALGPDTDVNYIVHCDPKTTDTRT